MKCVQEHPLLPVFSVIVAKPTLVINGLKKPGVHDLVHRGSVVDGQQQQEMTSEGLGQGNLCGIGQHSNSHVNALQTKEGHTVRACEEHCRQEAMVGNSRKSENGRRYPWKSGGN